MKKSLQANIAWQYLLTSILICFGLFLLADGPDPRLISLGCVGGAAILFSARMLHKRALQSLAVLFFLGCFLTALFLQCVKFELFPEYYFYDADLVQRIMVTGDAGILGISYLNTAWICNLLKPLFIMENQLFGGLFFFFCAVPVCTWTYLQAMQWIGNRLCLWGVAFSYSVLLPVFVLNTQKEAFQFFFFALIAIILARDNKITLIKLLCYGALMVVWSVCFRAYYLIILELVSSCFFYCRFKITKMYF